LLIMYYFSITYRQFATYLKSDPESFFPVSTIQLLRISVSSYILVTIVHNTCAQILINFSGARGGLWGQRLNALESAVKLSSMTDGDVDGGGGLGDDGRMFFYCR